MDVMSEPRRRGSTKAFTNHLRSAGAQGEVPKRRPSLASPLPPTQTVPSTPFPRSNPTANHQRALQQRPSIATSTCGSNLSGTGGLLKRLLAKPAPPLSPSAPSPSMSPGCDHANTNEDDHERHITCPQDLGPPADAPSTPGSTNEFDRSIRALDLVGQIDISMSPLTTAGLNFIAETPGFANKQRNVLRRRPSGTAVTKPPLPTLLTCEYPVGFKSIDDDSTPSATATPTPSTTPPPGLLRRSSSSSPTRHSASKNSSAFSGSSLCRPKTTPSHPTNYNKVNQSQVTPYFYTIPRDNSTTVVAGGSGDLSREDGGAGLARTHSCKWSKTDSDHQIRSKSSVHEFAKSFVDKGLGMAKKSPDAPVGGSPSGGFWKLVKKFSVNGLREKNLAESDHHPSVPSLPSHVTNDPFHTASDSSLLNSNVSLSTLASSPTTLVDKFPSVPRTPPPASAQHRTKLSHSSPHSPPSQPTTGPRPSTTTFSSSPSSDVDSSRFFNHQSARSSTSSLVEEAIPLPPLPGSSTSTATSKTNGKMNANDANTNLELQQHIIPPRNLSQTHPISDLPCISPIAITFPPPNVDDAFSQENEENEEITPSGQGDKEKDATEPNADRDSNRSQSPTIPSFSTSSAINSFPARRVSSSLSPRLRVSPVGQVYSSSSSGNTIITAKSKSTHTAASSVSMPASPTITYHRRSMSFNTSSPALATRGMFSTLNPFSDGSNLSPADSTPHITSLPPPIAGPSVTSSMSHRTRTPSNRRSAFPTRKLSEVLFSSSSPTRASPSVSSSHRKIGSLMSRSFSISASSRSKSNTSNPAISSQRHTQLTDQEKTDKWNDLLDRSARAGGTLHLAAGSRSLGSDDI